MTTRYSIGGRPETLARRPVDAPNGGPLPLPYSAYPGAADVARQGLQPLPASLPPGDFAWAKAHRSVRYSAVVATGLGAGQLLQMARVIASGFARREPQARHLRPPRHPPAGLMEVLHADPFGIDPFGPWDTETHMYWIARLLALTDPTSPRDAIEVNWGTLEQSVVILDGTGRVVGAAFNETMPPFDAEPPLRAGDPFLDTVVEVWEPVYAALGALCERYPAFREAYARGRVGHHLLVARSDDLPAGDAFELVAASAERYLELGYEYMVTEATNQWTGAAFEALGGVRVHLSPFRAEPAVVKSAEPLEGVTTRSDGFLSDKDSGGMFYALRLA
jgi:hypothetical protein